MDKGYTLGRLKAFDTSMLKAFRYYEREFSLHRAERFEDAVYECIEIIARNPHTFQIRYKDIRAGIVSRFPYLVLYRINENKKQVQFTRIVRQSQDWLK